VLITKSTPLAGNSLEGSEMEKFNAREGSRIVIDIARAVEENVQYLSEIDGAIGDGDHGVNLNKGFAICKKELEENPGDMSYGLRTLAKVLMVNIGGSIGPLYGSFFRAMSKVCENNEYIDGSLFREMLNSGQSAIVSIGNAKVGDKTLLDTLVPATEAFNTQMEESGGFSEALDAMVNAAKGGRDSTKNMVAKLGRASQLGDRSLEMLDPGAVSCFLILESISRSIKVLLEQVDTV